MGLFRLNFILDEAIACIGALVQSPVALLSEQGHLLLEHRLAAWVRHANALPLDVLLHDVLCLGVLESFTHIIRVVLVVGHIADEAL